MSATPASLPDPRDVIGLTQALVRCPSVTPQEGGAQRLLAGVLQALGAKVEQLRFEAPGTAPVDNLLVTIGKGRPHLAFCGHTDVVPVGDEAAWQHDPFGGEIADERLWGRGACDMKAGVAAFVSALAQFVDAYGVPHGAVSLLITGDEEGPSVNGVRKLLPYALDAGHVFDGVLVGEPTSRNRIGDMIKIGRRGSLYGTLTVTGKQGHVAYPQDADNPLTRLTNMLHAMLAGRIDGGDAHFQASNLQITSIDTGNEARNVIPSRARALFNIRFAPSQSIETLEAWLKARIAPIGGDYELDLRVTAEPTYTEPGPLSELVRASIKEVCGIEPELSTSGGTSDARFFKDVAPVVEVGTTGRSMHQVDEYVPLTDIGALRAIYLNILRGFFEITPARADG
ncbi:MAG: succinyl-diaminopimelate desuccinylase [Geminicoccaceae bacterium]